METDRVWNDPLPDGFAPEGELRLCVKADLLPDGSYGQEWLVVTDSQLYVVGESAGQIQPRLALPFAEVTEPKVETLVDGGAFGVSHDGGPVELVRFTTARSARFATAAQTLEDRKSVV